MLAKASLRSGGFCWWAPGKPSQNGWRSRGGNEARAATVAAKPRLLVLARLSRQPTNKTCQLRRLEKLELTIIIHSRNWRQGRVPLAFLTEHLRFPRWPKICSIFLYRTLDLIACEQALLGVAPQESLLAGYRFNGNVLFPKLLFSSHYSIQKWSLKTKCQLMFNRILPTKTIKIHPKQWGE